MAKTIADSRKPGGAAAQRRSATEPGGQADLDLEWGMIQWNSTCDALVTQNQHPAFVTILVDAQYAVDVKMDIIVDLAILVISASRKPRFSEMAMASRSIQEDDPVQPCLTVVGTLSRWFRCQRHGITLQYKVVICFNPMQYNTM